MLQKCICRRCRGTVQQIQH